MLAKKVEMVRNVTLHNTSVFYYYLERIYENVISNCLICSSGSRWLIK